MNSKGETYYESFLIELSPQRLEPSISCLILLQDLTLAHLTAGTTQMDYFIDFLHNKCSKLVYFLIWKRKSPFCDEAMS